MLKTYFLIIFHFTITYGVECIHICCSNMLKILYNGVLCVFPPSSVFSDIIYVGSWNWPWKAYSSHQSVQFSRSVMSDSLRPHESQNARPPCPSPSPGVHSDSRPSSQWCHPAISSSVVPFFSCPQSFPTSGFFEWASSSHQVAKVLEFQLQSWSFQWTPRTDLL